jgi:very-short-patch-repair endonuclease
MKGISFEYPMYFGAKPSLFRLAKKLRKTETEAEKILWSKLNRNQIFDLQFRRQHPINIFIADFYCVRIKLIIEDDGSIHEIIENQEHDEGRSHILNDFGITVIRFTNEQILEEIDSTVAQIKMVAQKLLGEVKLSPPIGGFGGLISEGI